MHGNCSRYWIIAVNKTDEISALLKLHFSGERQAINKIACQMLISATEKISGIKGIRNIRKEPSSIRIFNRVVTVCLAKKDHEAKTQGISQMNIWGKDTLT